MIKSAEVTGYNGERKTFPLNHMNREFRTVTFCPNIDSPAGIQLQDKWLKTFNDLEDRLGISENRLNFMLGIREKIHWVKIKFNYTSYYG